MSIIDFSTLRWVLEFASYYEEEAGVRLFDNCATKRKCQNFINEFYVKPDESSNILIKELCGQLTDYYSSHRCKKIHYYRDKYGDSRNPNVLTSQVAATQSQHSQCLFPCWLY